MFVIGKTKLGITLGGTEGENSTLN